ncbi:exodeoxyribonuclease VII small subunit, partial [Lacticaseibacillus rhamnosus]
SLKQLEGIVAQLERGDLPLEDSIKMFEDGMRLSAQCKQELDSAHYLHPFTDHKALAAKGARIGPRADGVYIYTSEGEKILDGMSGLWCVALGYGRKELVEAARRRKANKRGAGAPLVTFDDALDYGGKAAKLGKNVGDDFREGKITLPVVLAFRRGNDAEREFWVRTLERGEIADGDNLVKALTALGYTTDLQYAEDDIPTQVSQVENMITKGAKVLVIAAIDGTTLTDTLQKAADSGIK